MIEEDYRKSQSDKNKRIVYPLNSITNFNVNKLYRQITKEIQNK